MAPEKNASLAILARLRAEIVKDRSALTRCLNKLDRAEERLDQDADDAFALDVAAVALHGWYTGIESICERVARLLDGAVPQGERWHRELITQCTLELPGVRPPVLPTTVSDELHALLAFRHFFRHAYGVELEGQRVRAEMTRLWKIVDAVDQTLDAFDGFLGQTIEAIGRDA